MAQLCFKLLGTPLKVAENMRQDPPQLQLKPITGLLLRSLIQVTMLEKPF